jgi:hypothetical protein
MTGGGPGQVPLVDPKTGETMWADEGQLRSLKMPEGYVLAEDLSVKEWFAILATVTGRREE